jgi:hypothetical protein
VFDRLLLSSKCTGLEGGSVFAGASYGFLRVALTTRAFVLKND